MTHQLARATKVRFRLDIDAVAISTVVLLACVALPVGKLRMMVDAAGGTDEDRVPLGCTWVEVLETVVAAAVPVATGTETETWSEEEAEDDKASDEDKERDAEPTLCDCTEELAPGAAVTVTTTVLSTTEVERTTDVDSGMEALAVSMADEVGATVEEVRKDSAAEVVESGRLPDVRAADETESVDAVADDDSALEADALKVGLTAAVEVTATDDDEFEPADEPPPTASFPR